MVEAIVFDLDDTLYLEEDFVISGFQAVSDYLIRFYSLNGFYEVAKDYYEKGMRGDIFDKSLKLLGVKDYEIIIPDLVEVYREHSPKITLLDDAKWAINYFSNKMLGIITDGYLTTQQKKINALGIADKFAVIIFTDQNGRENWKPSSFPYLQFMELTKLKGEQCIYIGDNSIKDYITAKKLGWKTINIRREKGEYSNIEVEESYEADYDIDSLYALKEIIR